MRITCLAQNTSRLPAESFIVKSETKSLLYWSQVKLTEVQLLIRNKALEIMLGKEGRAACQNNKYVTFQHSLNALVLTKWQ